MHPGIDLDNIGRVLPSWAYFVSWHKVCLGEILFSLTLDVEAPADQAPIQLETLSPVASHDLFSLFLWCGAMRVEDEKTTRISTVE